MVRAIKAGWISIKISIKALSSKIIPYKFNRRKDYRPKLVPISLIKEKIIAQN
jgi:hypothetical protein